MVTALHLCLAELHRVLKHDPADGFKARWSRKRTLVRPVTVAVRWQQRQRVKLAELLLVAGVLHSLQSIGNLSKSSVFVAHLNTTSSEL